MRKLKTNVTTNLVDVKKAFDEASLARVYVMATESLEPEKFESFMDAFNELKEHRRLYGIAENVVLEDNGNLCPICDGLEDR
jgi:hypothetical protein